MQDSNYVNPVVGENRRWGISTAIIGGSIGFAIATYYEYKEKNAEFGQELIKKVVGFTLGGAMFGGGVGYLLDKPATNFKTKTLDNVQNEVFAQAAEINSLVLDDEETPFQLETQSHLIDISVFENAKKKAEELKLALDTAKAENEAIQIVLTNTTAEKAEIENHLKVETKAKDDALTQADAEKQDKLNALDQVKAEKQAKLDALDQVEAEKQANLDAQKEAAKAIRDKDDANALADCFEKAKVSAENKLKMFMNQDVEAIGMSWDKVIASKKTRPSSPSNTVSSSSILTGNINSPSKLQMPLNTFSPTTIDNRSKVTGTHSASSVDILPSSPNNTFEDAEPMKKAIMRKAPPRIAQVLTPIKNKKEPLKEVSSPNVESKVEAELTPSTPSSIRASGTTPELSITEQILNRQKEMKNRREQSPLTKIEKTEKKDESPQNSAHTINFLNKARQYQ